MSGFDSGRKIPKINSRQTHSETIQAANAFLHRKVRGKLAAPETGRR
jgi:hypothetical protein